MNDHKTFPRTVHKVEQRQLDRYLDYLIENVRADCGTVFEPARPIHITPEMPRCKICFPERPKFAWAA